MKKSGRKILTVSISGSIALILRPYVPVLREKNCPE